MSPQRFERLKARRIKALEESIAFFGADEDRKFERESWDVQAFLTNLHINFETTEIVKPQDAAADVVFQDAAFQVKEIMDPGRRRHTEFKAELERVREATSLEQMGQLGEDTDWQGGTLRFLFDACLERMKGMRPYSPEAKASTDLLFYLNLRQLNELVDEAMPDTTEMQAMGWRSVSFLEGHTSGVFCATNDAPALLKDMAGRLSYRYPEDAKARRDWLQSAGRLAGHGES